MKSDGPIAAAERGWSEGVRETDQRADQSWQRDDLKELVRGVMKAGLRQLRCDDAPEQPDRKAEMLGDDRPDEIAAGWIYLSTPRSSHSLGSSPKSRSGYVCSSACSFAVAIGAPL